MSVSNVRDSKQFGKKQEPRTITISNNGKVQQYKVSAFICVFAFCVFAMSMIGYVGATGYLAFRDDLIASTIVRQSRLKQEYEDRIASLRSKVDIVTSRQLLDQRAVESKVSSLIQQQELLQGRSDELNILFDRAKQSGLDPDKLIGNDLA
ncbi:MAG: M23 family peptidase, partial [Nitratireductor sp.]